MKNLLSFVFILCVTVPNVFAQTSAGPLKSECSNPCGPGGGDWQAVPGEKMFIEGQCTTRVVIEALNCGDPVKVHSIRIKSITSNCYQDPTATVWRIIGEWAGGYLPGTPSFFDDLLNHDTSKIVRLVFPSCMRACSRWESFNNTSPLPSGEGQTLSSAGRRIFYTIACNCQCCVLEFKTQQVKCLWRISSLGARNYFDNCDRPIDPNCIVGNCPDGSSPFPANTPVQCTYVCNPQ